MELEFGEYYTFDNGFRELVFIPLCRDKQFKNSYDTFTMDNSTVRNIYLGNVNAYDLENGTVRKGIHTKFCETSYSKMATIVAFFSQYEENKDKLNLKK